VQLRGYDFSADVARCKPETFDCGGRQCKELTEYCEIDSADLSYACKPLLGSCTFGVVDCACLSEGGIQPIRCDQQNPRQVTVTL
jgi:hypothetical protein